jgi:hypothetical protein
MMTMEWHWTPSVVWQLTLREFCMYADIIDAVVEQRKRASRG